jgi:endonuclease-3
MNPKQERQKQHATTVLDRLLQEFPEPECALIHDGPFQLLIATILSAQCTDARVNQVTPTLFEAGPDAQQMKALGLVKIRRLIQSINFFNNKAKNILETCRILTSQYDGKVPQTLDELTALPGVGRKTANVVLGNAFGIPGMVVDTHVKRISNLLGWTKNTDPEKIEVDLEKLFEPEDWVNVSHVLILHGRKTCVARRPRCETCAVNDLCPSRKIPR